MPKKTKLDRCPECGHGDMYYAGILTFKQLSELKPQRVYCSGCRKHFTWYPRTGEIKKG